MTIELTPLQDRLIAYILTQPHGNARSDTLGKAAGVPPSSVSGSLLTLRSQGIIGSANDGGAYNYWFVTEKGRAFLNQRACAIRVADHQRRIQAERTRQLQLKADLLEKQRQRALIQQAEDRQRIKDNQVRALQQAAREQATLGSPVTTALAKAMNEKGFNPIPDPKFIVWSPESKLPPKVQYATKEGAQHVAESMAQRHPNQVFIVCELLTVAYYTPPKQIAGGIVRGTL